MNLKIFLSISICIFLTGCGLASKKEAMPASANVKNDLNKAEIEYNSGAVKKAMARLNRIITQHNQTDAADDANIMLGHIYYRQSEFPEAYRAFIAVINSEYFSPREVEAAIGAAKALNKMARYDEALNLTGRALKYKPLSEATQTEIYTLRYQIQNQLGDRVDALKSLIFLAGTAKDNEQKERFKIKAQEIVESNLKDSELETIAQDSDFGFVRLQALYRVGILYFEQKDYGRAEKYFGALIDLAPDSDLAQESKNYLEQLQARRRVAPYTIGAVLPLSGKHNQIALKTLHGLQMGLGISGDSPSDFKLAVIDSAGNPDLARRGVERLVIEDSTIAIVGDLLSKTAEPVAQKANELGVPIIGLSQKSGLTNIGENVFRNALTSEAIVNALAQSAMEKHGLRRFAILYPNDAYGIEYANLFWDAVLARGGEITAAQTYSGAERDFRSTINRLVGTYYVEARTSEYTALVKEWYSQQKVITSRVVPPSDLLPPIVDFDAIFIPDGVKALGQISSMLTFNDIKNVKLLGTNLWNTPSVIDRGSTLIEDSLFIDAKSVVDNSLSRTAFAREYKKLFGEDPSSFEAQAYDTGLALRYLIQGGARSRGDLRERLSRLDNISGSEGSIRISEDREFSRPLSVLTVKGKQIRVASDPIQTIKK